MRSVERILLDNFRLHCALQRIGSVMTRKLNGYLEAKMWINAAKALPLVVMLALAECFDSDSNSNSGASKDSDPPGSWDKASWQKIGNK